MPEKIYDANTGSAPAELPAWFDDVKHSISDYGIHDRATGALLTDDGLPANATLRAAAIDARAVAAVPSPAPATPLPTLMRAAANLVTAEPKE